MATLAETIKHHTKKHLLENNGLLFGQCVTAVGWVGGTIPELYEKDGVIELPTSDVSNGGIVTGAGLMGRRPIYVIRYQGFGWYNLPIILNYACKSKELWDRPCPIFIRAIGMEGNIGPCATGSHHGICGRMPGIVIKSPMTPHEWTDVWNDFLQGDDPVYCNEHRLGFPIDYEMLDDVASDYSSLDCIVFAISNGRLNALKAQKELKKQGVSVAIFHLVDLKPFSVKLEHRTALQQCGCGIVVDSDFQDYGVATQIAHDLTMRTNKPVYTLGLENRTAGFASHCDNLTPSPEKIVERIKEII